MGATEINWWPITSQYGVRFRYRFWVCCRWSKLRHTIAAVWRLHDYGISWRDSLSLGWFIFWTIIEDYGPEPKEESLMHERLDAAVLAQKVRE